MSAYNESANSGYAYVELQHIQNIRDVERACQFVRIDDYESLEIVMIALYKYGESRVQSRNFYENIEHTITKSYIDLETYIWMSDKVPMYVLNLFNII
jgi:hypothetical protein